MKNKTWEQIKKEGWENRDWIPDKKGKRRKIDSPNKGDMVYWFEGKSQRVCLTTFTDRDRLVTHGELLTKLSDLDGKIRDK